ncbi:ATP-binding cassette domain-containing protein [Corynebacterium striatum]
MPISFTDLTIVWPDGKPCFSNLNGTFSAQFTGLVGNNGSGKSTLAKVLAGILEPTSGTVSAPSVGYLDQDLGLKVSDTVADVFHAREVLEAIEQIEAGHYTDELVEVVGEHWDLKEKISAALAASELPISLDRTIGSLSGGEAVTVALTALFFSEPDVFILDEPTNNLDAQSKELLLSLIADSPAQVLVISHDRDLLNHADCIAELYHGSLRMFTGNYASYEEAIDQEQDAALADVHQAKAALRKEVRQRSAMQTRLARDERRGKKYAASKRKPPLAMGLDKNRSQNTAAKRSHEAA